LYAARAVKVQAEQIAKDAGVTDVKGAAVAAREEEEAHQVALLRDIAGDPRRPVALSGVWLTPNVLALTQAMYEQRYFDRMPQLADALEEAGCSDSAILGHCRNGREHVRGCWVLDLLLARG
jgi:hypothetical protein